MKIALRYMGREHRNRELPEIISVCTKPKLELNESVCGCVGPPKRFKKIHVKTIPHGKRYFDIDPCKDTHVCDPLLAKTATLSKLRETYRFGCCPKCKV